MFLLNAPDISKSYTASPLLSNLSYAINEGDKIRIDTRTDTYVERVND